MNDTLPTALTQFGDELTRAIASELSSLEPTAPPPQRRPPHRPRLVAGAVAACALAGVVVVLIANGSGSTNTAYDQHVLRAADIALPKPAPNTIVHVSVTQTMTPAARGKTPLLVPTVDAEGWFQQGGPQRSVTREHVPNQAPTWQTASRIYDPATKLVYVSPPFPSSHPRFTLTNNGRAGLYTLRIETSRYGLVRETITSAQAQALRRGADGIQWFEGLDASGRFFVNASVVSGARSSNASLAGPPSSTSLTFPAQLHRLLQSGHARVDGRVTIDGRSAIKIAISGVSGYQRMIYYVDATTYRPIELNSYGITSKDLTRIVFHAYQQLPLKGNARLLRLHTAAGTNVNDNPADFFRHIPALLFW